MWVIFSNAKEKFPPLKFGTFALCLLPAVGLLMVFYPNLSNLIGQVFDDEQVKHLGAAATVKHPKLGDIRIVSQPVKLSRTPAAVSYTLPPQGSSNDEVLVARSISDSIAGIAVWFVPAALAGLLALVGLILVLGWLLRGAAVVGRAHGQWRAQTRTHHRLQCEVRWRGLRPPPPWPEPPKPPPEPRGRLPRSSELTNASKRLANNLSISATTHPTPISR